MATQTYQIQISLRDSKPKIWRRILVPSDVLLIDFHEIIQITMGWDDSHLHQFVKDGIYYSIQDPDDDFWNEMDNIDYQKKEIKLADLLITEKSKLTYEYDFGDGWVHNIVLEKILPFDKNMNLPVCLKGKMHCPPEDCGGLWGYYDILEILKQPKHKEFKYYKGLVGKDFDPEFFDIDDVNNMLQ